MCGEQKFFICKHCGNIIGMIHNSGVPMICCGEKMNELVPNTKEASLEKHLPVIEKQDRQVTVKIGSVPHPMLPEHYIQWVYLLTNQGGHRKCLLPGNAPEVTFTLSEGEILLSAYEYCNLHGLWKASL